MGDIVRFNRFRFFPEAPFSFYFLCCPMRNSHQSLVIRWVVICSISCPDCVDEGNAFTNMTTIKRSDHCVGPFHGHAILLKSATSGAFRLSQHYAAASR